MPVSAAPFVSKTAVGFVPATSANVLSGTTTVSSGTAGNYGIAIAASLTVKLAFPLPIPSQQIAERYPNYEQYNLPKMHTLSQNGLTVYYSVAGAALTSMSLGLYATSYTATGGVVTTLLAQLQGGLSLAIGTYAVTFSLKNLPSIPYPNSVLVAELDIVTPASSSAVINGVSYN
jgi:hypothetical protein